MVKVRDDKASSTTDKKASADGDDNLLREMLLECPSEHTRIVVSDLVTSALAHLTAYEFNNGLWGKVRLKLEPSEDFSDISVSCQVINSLFSLLDYSRGVWRRFKQYFEVMRYFN